MKITTTIEEITPGKAKRYLTCNKINRTVRELTVSAYARDMKMGNWLVTHQGIAFDDKGNLIDGQHRLLAIIESGSIVKMAVTRGLPQTHFNGTEIFTMDVVDRGKTRTTGDQLTVLHGIRNGGKISAGCMVIGWIASGHNRAMSTPQALAILSVYRTQLEQIIDVIGGFKPGRVAPVFGALAFCAASHPKEAVEFASRLATGEDIKRGMPVYALRNALINGSAVTRSWTDRKAALVECVGNSMHNTIIGEPITLLKRGVNGINFFRAKQRTNVEKITAALGYQTT